MELHFSPEVDAKLSRLADCYDWFLQEVDKGLAAADRGEFVEHEASRELIDRRWGIFGVPDVDTNVDAARVDARATRPAGRSVG